MDTLVDPFEVAAEKKASNPKQPSAVDVDIDWQDTTSESHPGVSIESWRRARGWTTED
jgi:hypothetical protein